MKKIKPLLFLFLATTATFLTACSTDVEPLDPALLGELPPVNPGTNPRTNPGTNPATPSGDYWPMVVYNTWVYKNNGTTEPPMKIISSEQIAGKTYYKYSNFVGTSTVQQLDFSGNVWSRKENGTYFIRQEANIPAQNGNPAIAILPTEVQILKDNLAVNQTWTHTFTQTMLLGTIPVPSEVEILGTVLEKGV
jgi:hypothetical protein